MAFFGDGDIDDMLSDMGVPVVIGGVQGLGLLDTPDRLLMENGDRSGIIGAAIAVLLKTSDFPTLKVGDALTVDGVQYTARERLREGDGALVRVMCFKV